MMEGKNTDILPQATKEKLIKLSTSLSVASAIIVTLIKLYVWYKTQSLAIMSALMESILDISTSVINYFAVRFAMLPPDNKHRFGHNKIEDLAVFAQSFFFLSSGIFTIGTVFYKSFTGYAITNSDLGINYILIVLILNICILTYQKYTIKVTNSNIVRADYMHYFADLITHCSILVSLYFSSSIIPDIVASIYIGGYIIYSSVALIRSSLAGLIDEELGQEDKNKITEILKQFPQVMGAHELRTRKAGDKKFIQLHVELDGNLSLNFTHMISDQIAEKICFALGKDTDVMIHQDPFVQGKPHMYPVL